MHRFFKESVIHMKPKIARSLAIHIAQVMERYDHWGYYDALGDYDDSEELFLEDLVGQILTNPEKVIGDLLDTMDAMMEDLELR